MRMLILGCRTMREGVLATLVFLVVGLAMILASVKVVPEFAYMQHIVLWLGFLMVLFAPVILVSTFLLSVLPGAKERLDKCDH